MWVSGSGWVSVGIQGDLDALRFSRAGSPTGDLGVTADFACAHHFL